MDPSECDRLQRLSRALAGHNCVVPVAVALHMGGAAPQSAPEVVQTLHGCLPANRVAEALRRLVTIGAARELPYPGRPHPRMFEVVQGPFWDFIRDWAMDPSVDCVHR